MKNINLLKDLQQLHLELRQYTKEKYNRINPFCEDLFPWKEKGEFFGGKNVTIYDSTTIAGDVKIGDNSWIGPFCSLDGTGRLTIGKYCSISAGTQILTHDTVKNTLSGGHHPFEYSPVRMGDCCFVGVQSIIIKGVSIGNHCLIGANSLVNKSFKKNSIIAGTPAKKIGNVIIREDTIELEYSKF
jgi:acetyltransferase-like isoleucine patch superfamily enzyme